MHRINTLLLAVALRGGPPAWAASPPTDRSLSLLSDLAAQAPVPNQDEVPKLPDKIRESVQRCFQDLAERDGRPGRIEVEVDAAEGTVTQASVQKNETADVLVASCIIDAVKGGVLDDHPAAPFTWVFTLGEG